MKNILIIGNGRWSKVYQSTLQQSFPDVSFIIATKDYLQIIIKNSVDGVIICTPPQSHIEIAKDIMQFEVPMLIEKPLSLNSNDIKQLKNYKYPILVNHLHLFADAYKLIKNNIAVETIRNINTSGCNKGPFRDYSALWDYGPHDISLILDITNKNPQSIYCKEYEANEGYIYKISMAFDTFTTLSIVGNGSSKRSREITIEKSNGYLKYNDLDNIEPPLTSVLHSFISNLDKKDNINDARYGLEMPYKIAKILEFCELSMKNKEVIKVKNDDFIL